MCAGDATIGERVRTVAPHHVSPLVAQHATRDGELTAKRVRLVGHGGGNPLGNHGRAKECHVGEPSSRVYSERSCCGAGGGRSSEGLKEIIFGGLC